MDDLSAALAKRGRRSAALHRSTLAVRLARPRRCGGPILAYRGDVAACSFPLEGFVLDPRKNADQSHRRVLILRLAKRNRALGFEIAELGGRVS